VTEEEFAALYGATAQALWKYLYRACGRRDVADDLLQEAYLRFIGRERTEMRIEDARPYLFRIASNLLHDRWRRREGTLPFLDFVAESVVAGSETAADTLKMLSRLRPRSRELLILAYVEGMTHQEIAKVTGLRAISVRVLLSRARHEALRLLQAEGETHGE
jgi:RNA polymerase sigma-70 factor (ECF subfamily)